MLLLACWRGFSTFFSGICSGRSAGRGIYSSYSSVYHEEFRVVFGFATFIVGFGKAERFMKEEIKAAT